MKKKAGGNFSYANRGRALEDLIELSNERYRKAGVAVIHRVPAAWLPIRDGRGRIVSAKIEKKAAVDFIGHIITAEDYALPVVFDAKEVSKGKRWPLSRLEEHQYQYLVDSARTGAAAFVLIVFWEYSRFFMLPIVALEEKVRAYHSGGPASVDISDSALVEISFPDYLRLIISKPAGFLFVKNSCRKNSA
jgi:recombination protein U